MLDLVIIDGKRYPYNEPRYQRPADLDLTKQWLVRFEVWSEAKHELVLKRTRVKGETITQRDIDAKRLMREINEALKAGAFVDPLPEGTDVSGGNARIGLIAALTGFMKEKKRTLKKQSNTTYEKWERYFLEFLVAEKLEDLYLDQFNNAHAAKMRTYSLDIQKMGNKTFNSYKGFVSGLFNYYKDIFSLPANPIAKTITKLKEKTSKHTAYNDQLIEAYRNACFKLDLPELWFFVRVIYYTFCRPWEEVRRMQVGDIKANHIMVYAENSKTGHRSVMIPPALEKVFAEWNLRKLPPHYYVFSHNGQPGPTLVGKSYMYEKHIKVLSEMKLLKAGYDIYGWKHTGTIELYKATKDLMLIKEQCGHSDIAQTVQYLRDLGVFHYSSGIEKFPEI